MLSADPKVAELHISRKFSKCNSFQLISDLLNSENSRSHHDAAHLQPLTNVPTKHQLPTPYGFRDIAWTRYSNSRSLRQGQRSNQGHTMTLHTYTP